MRIYDIIAKKRDGLALSEEEIRFFVSQYTQGMIPDYQASALLMAICINGMDRRETTDLTKNEYRILQALMEQKGKVVSRETLMERLWATDSFVDENTLTVNVNRLRKKLDKAGLHDFIRTKVGMGYLVE